MSKAPRPRVLICEDSRTYAAALQRVIEHDGLLDVVGVARSAEDAITPSVAKLAVGIELSAGGGATGSGVRVGRECRVRVAIASRSKNLADGVQALARRAQAPHSLRRYEPDQVPRVTSQSCGACAARMPLAACEW